MTGRNPFFAFYGTRSPSMLPVLFTNRAQSVPSYPIQNTTKDAATAASLSNAGSEAPARATQAFPLHLPLLSISKTTRKSKGQLLPNDCTQHRRFFPAFKPTGVVWGALRLWMRCLEKSENLKIVQAHGSSAPHSLLQVGWRFVSRNFIASIKISLHYRSHKLYAVSLNWQCVPTRFDYTLEVAA